MSILTLIETIKFKKLNCEFFIHFNKRKKIIAPIASENPTIFHRLFSDISIYQTSFEDHLLTPLLYSTAWKPQTQYFPTLLKNSFKMYTEKFLWKISSRKYFFHWKQETWWRHLVVDPLKVYDTVMIFLIQANVVGEIFRNFPLSLLGFILKWCPSLDEDESGILW